MWYLKICVFLVRMEMTCTRDSGPCVVFKDLVSTCLSGMNSSSAKAGDQPPSPCIASTTTKDKKAGPWHRQEHQIPPGGMWWLKQSHMLAAYAAGGKTGHTVAWDKKGEQIGAKLYGLYDSVEAFYASLLQCNSNHRFGYELMPTGTPCKAYIDIEWVGPEDPEHSTLKRLLAYFRERASELWPQKTKDEWEIHVACGTRPTDSGLAKNSYHVVFSNLVFECNKDMGQLFAVPSEREEFWWDYDSDEKRKQRCMVDQTVYTDNRNFRTLYSTKRCPKGNVPPLLRLKNDNEVRSPTDSLWFAYRYTASRHCSTRRALQ